MFPPVGVSRVRRSCTIIIPAIILLVQGTAANAEDSDTQMPAVTVSASQPSQSSETDQKDPAKAGAGFKQDKVNVGPLGEKKALDTPYSIYTVDSTVIENTASSSMSDLLKLLPSTQMEARGSMDVGRPQSRGMEGNVATNTHIDGFNFVSTTASAMEMFDHVDVINSLTGALYGPANPAGNFDFYTKRPTDTPLLRFSAGFENGSQIKEATDISARVGKNKMFGYRVNLLHEEGDGYVTGSKSRRDLAAVDFDIHFNPDTVLQLDGSYYKFLTTGYPGSFTVSALGYVPSAPDPTKQGYGETAAGYRLETKTGSFLLKHNLSSDWKLSTGLMRQIVQRDQSGVGNTISSSGEITQKVNGGPGQFTVDSDQLMLNGTVTTGSLKHDLVIGTNGYELTMFGTTGSGTTVSGLAAGTYDDPTASLYDYTTSGYFYRSSSSASQSVVLGDTLTINDQWSLLGMASYSMMSTHSYSSGTKVYEQGLSPTISLMYKPRPNMMTYIGYADSLQQGDSVTDTTANNYGDILDPYRSKQIEAGFKWDLGQLHTQTAIFRLQRPLAYTGSDGYYREQGNQVNHGLEFMASGNVTKNLGLFGGVTFLDPRLKSTYYSEAENKEVVGVPRVQANILGEYSINYVPGLVLTGNIHYTDKRAANNTNTAYVASYTTEDIGARYTTHISSKKTTFRFNITNITNEHYWVSVFPSTADLTGTGSSATWGTLFLGAPRMFSLSATVDL